MGRVDPGGQPPGSTRPTGITAPNRVVDDPCQSPSISVIATRRTVMSRRKIFEDVRRRPVGRRRFLLAADVLEERTLLSYLVPSQIRHAYGVDQITFTGPGGTAIHGDGAGQTIAILGLGNDPTILPDLQYFDRILNLPDPPSFQQINNLKVGVDPSGVEETSIDVEWAHAIAPAANILLFDFSPGSFINSSATSLVDEVQYVTQNY